MNKNSFDAVQSLNDDPSNVSAENTALFSELAILAAKEYIKTEQKNKLMESLSSNQGSVGAYVKQMQSAIVTMAQISTQEHSEKQQGLARNLIGLVGNNQGGRNDAEIQRVIGVMIDQKTSHSDQMESLNGLYVAYGKIPGAHEALAAQLAKPDTSLAAINDLLEKGVQLQASYQSKAKINKAELVQARADAANSEATAAEVTYQQAKLKYAQAQFEYVSAQSKLDEDPDSDIKKQVVEEKRRIAEELRVESGALKESAESLRAAATAVQESANELKKSIINN